MDAVTYIQLFNSGLISVVLIILVVILVQVVSVMGRVKKVAERVETASDVTSILHNVRRWCSKKDK